MKLDFLAGVISAAIHYQIADVDPIVQREGQRFEFQPQTVRVLVSGDEIQVQVEGPRKLARGILSPIQRVTERYNRADLDNVQDTPNWVVSLGLYWLEVAAGDSRLKEAIRNEKLLMKTGS